MRNEIVDEIVRAERIAGTLLSTAKQNATLALQKTNASNLDKQKKASISNKKLYKELLMEQEGEAKSSYDSALATCKAECDSLKINCEKNIVKVAKLLFSEVKN